LFQEYIIEQLAIIDRIHQYMIIAVCILVWKQNHNQ